MRFILPLALLALTSCATPTPDRLLDDQGREMIFHGLNMSNAAKNDPMGTAWHQEADFQRMHDEWGFNAVRLLMFWALVEPQPGVYDTAYLDRMKQRLDWAHNHGIHVVLDFHQDLYGGFFGGDGAPDWAVRDDGHAFTSQDPWWLNYIEPAVLAAFTHFWKDADLRAHYAAAWGKVAEHFAGHPAILGYDTMNEPFYGTILPGVFERKYLTPFHQECATAIRAHHPDALLFFEPPAFPTASGLPSLMPASSDPLAVYAPHYYDPLVHESLGYFGNSALMKRILSIKASEANRHGTPLFIGELGAPTGGQGHERYLRNLFSALDHYGASWTYWSYDKGYDSGTGYNGFSILDELGQEKPVMDILVRPYPRRIAGELDQFSYDPQSRVFSLEFHRNSATGPTEVFVPGDRTYGGSFQVTSSDPTGSWSWDYNPTNGLLRYWADPQSAHHSLTITP